MILLCACLRFVLRLSLVFACYLCGCVSWIREKEKERIDSQNRVKRKKESEATERESHERVEDRLIMRFVLGLICHDSTLIPI